jgi:hypothetical protein
LTCQDLAAKACGVHKSSVSQISTDIRKSTAQRDQLHHPERKSACQKATNLYNFCKDVHRIVLGFYDRRISISEKIINNI